MSNRKYSAIVFDLGQVLLKFDYDVAIKRINKHQPGLGEKFMDHYRNNYHIHRNFEKGVIKENEFINSMLQELNSKIDAETFCRYYSEIFTFNEKVIALLPELKKKYKLYLMSNTNSLHKKYGYQDYDFLKLFNSIILSHEVGFVKPEEGIYKAVETASCILPEEHIFIDDIKDYSDQAIKMSWDAIHFIGYENLISELSLRKII